MAQNDYYHTGYFRVTDEYAESGYYEVSSLSVSIAGESHSWWVSFYGDSRHTIEWLQSRGLLEAEICPGVIRY